MRVLILLGLLGGFVYLVLTASHSIGDTPISQFPAPSTRTHVPVVQAGVQIARFADDGDFMTPDTQRPVIDAFCAFVNCGQHNVLSVTTRYDNRCLREALVAYTDRPGPGNAMRVKILWNNGLFTALGVASLHSRALAFSNNRSVEILRCKKVRFDGHLSVIEIYYRIV